MHFPKDNCCKKYPHIGIIKPLHNRVRHIRDSNANVAPYHKKFFSLPEEINEAKINFTIKRIESARMLISRAISSTRRGCRSVQSFVAFFKTIYKQASTKQTKDGLVEYFLQEFKHQETIHYEQLEFLSQAEKKARTDNFIESINATKVEKIITDVDCLAYFNVQTIKDLKILSDQDRYNRRFNKIKNSTTMLQSKGNLISGSVPIKLNYVIHHYILSAMDIKEEKLDYPVLPLSKLNFMERMFRSYIDVEGVPSVLILDLMLDFFINEVQYNHKFWVLLISRFSEMTSKQASTNSNAQSPYLTGPNIVSQLLGLKFEFFYDSNMSIPSELFYVAALLIKNQPASLEHLLPYIMNNNNNSNNNSNVNTNINTNNDNQTQLVNKNENNTQPTQYSYNTTILAMTLISIGEPTITNKLLKKPFIDTESLLIWINELISHIINRMYNARISKTTTVSVQQQQQQQQHNIYVDSEDELDSENSDVFSDLTDKSNIGYNSNNNSKDSYIKDAFTSSFNIFNSNFFYTDKRQAIYQSDSLELFGKALLPIIGLLDIEKIDTTTINKIIEILSTFAKRSTKLHRTDYGLFMNKIVFPALIHNSIIDPFVFLSRLDGQQRLDIYQQWQKNIDTRNERIRNQCNIALQSTKELLTQSLSTTANNAMAIKSIRNIALKHPTEVAYQIVTKIITPVLNNHIASSHNHLRVITEIYRGSSNLAWDVLISLLADQAISMTGRYWSETATLLPTEQDKENCQNDDESYDLKLPKRINYLSILSDSIVKKTNHESDTLRDYLQCFFHDDIHTRQYPCLEKLPSFYKEKFIESMCPIKSTSASTSVKRSIPTALLSNNNNKRRIY